MELQVVMAIQAWRNLNRANDNNRSARQRALDRAMKNLNFQQREEFEKYQQEGTP